MKRRACVLLTLLCACSGGSGDVFEPMPGKDGAPGADGKNGQQGPPGADAAASGDRIKAQWIAGADGSRSFVRFFDSELQKPCYFGAAPDGVLRCLPSLAGGAVAFTDPQCTQPIAVANMCSPPIQYATAFETFDMCTSYGTTVYNVGPVLAAPAALFVYSPLSDSCSPTALGVTDVFYAVGLPVDYSAFVAAELETDP